MQTLWCCEPTYEELKLCICEPEGIEVIGCEPTYEELKLEQTPNSATPLKGCEPTYEELKHHIHHAPFGC